jgi:hypothetical protein
MAEKNNITMKENFIIPLKAKIFALILVAIGLIALIFGFVTDASGTWPVLLLNNFYFLSLALGAMFFIAIQYVTESGWSAMFKRVPEAMTSFVPVALVIMLAMFAGIREIYEWSLPGIAEKDALIAHKAPFLNVPFFYLRLLVVFGAWILLIFIMRRFSLREDAEGGTEWFRKSKTYSMVFIFVFAITFSIAAFDWIMSIDSHWFSTIFGIRAIISSFYFSVAAIILLVLWLNQSGYFGSMNIYHRNDFARYLFRLSIIYGYLWFMQYLIIWYANLPETTFYFVYRVHEPWTFLFYAELILNWTIPFTVLMSDDFARKKAVLITVSILLLIGFYISLYLQIMPGTTGVLNIGFVEIGSFLGFAGLFLFLFLNKLSKAPLLPGKHPYLEESLRHHL